MVQGAGSGCVNHPGVEAVARCKACHKPVCGMCVVAGPTGQFCSESCKEKHEAYVKRAQQLDRTSRRTGQLTKLRRFLVKLVIFVVAIGALAFGAIYFQIPVLKTVVQKALHVVSPYLPF